MNNKQQLELIEIKEDAIMDEIEELERLYDLNNIEEYRKFNNVFISSVKTLRQIMNRTVVTQMHENKYVDFDEYCVNGEVINGELKDKLTKINPVIINFINEMISKFATKSKYLLKLKQDEILDYSNGIDTQHSKEYKYTQQIIDDYMRLLIE